MEETVSYAKQYNYDTLKIGITVPVKLSLGEESAILSASFSRATVYQINYQNIRRRCILDLADNVNITAKIEDDGDCN